MKFNNDKLEEIKITYLDENDEKCNKSKSVTMKLLFIFDDGFEYYMEFDSKGGQIMKVLKDRLYIRRNENG